MNDADARIEVQAPIARLLRRGRLIYTVDTLGDEVLVSESPTPVVARWLFAALRTSNALTPFEELEDDLVPPTVPPAPRRMVRDNPQA